MRTLLINPWIYDFAAYDLWSKPLGLLNIATCLKKAGCEVRLIDFLDRFHPALNKFAAVGARRAVPLRNATSRHGSGFYHTEIVEKPELLKKIPRNFKRYGLPHELVEKLLDSEPCPDIILVTSGMTYWYPGVVETIKLAKQRFKGVPVLLGGIYANLCFEHAQKTSGADIVYKGNDLNEIIDQVFKTAGIEAKEDNIYGVNIVPAYELYDELKYITLRTSNGCPFKCSYCGWYLLEKKFIRQDPSFVSGYIEDLNGRYGVREFAFYDEALLYNPGEHIIPILKRLLDKNVSVNFHTPNGLHARFMTREIAELFERSNFIRPRLALETVSGQRQAATGAKTTTQDFLTAVKYLKEAGYDSKDIGVNILIGLPEQSYEEIEGSIRFAAANKVRIFLEEYSPIPGTPDYLRSGLPPDADPLLHNNSIFPLYHPSQHKKFQELKTLAQRANIS